MPILFLTDRVSQDYDINDILLIAQVDLKLMVVVLLAVLFAFGSEMPGSSSYQQVTGPTWGIICALGSNACYALRNIRAKYDGFTTIEGFTKMSFYGLGRALFSNTNLNPRLFYYHANTK